MLKIAYIGNRGLHSDNVNGSTRGDDRFCTCAVAGGTQDEDMTAYLAYIQKDHPDAKLYTDYIEMLETEKPDVAVVSPEFYLTATICMECAKRGVHIFAEKPVAISRGELAALKKVIQETGVHFMAMHFLRLSGANYQALCAVRNGEIGEVRMVNAQKSYKLGQRAAFYKSRKTYGGTIPWVGIHGIDWIYSMIQKPCVKVSACQSRVGNNGHGELEATCLCQFLFGNEVMASLQIDYLRPMTAADYSDDRVRVVGTKGTLEVRGKQLYLVNEDGEQTFEPETGKDLALDFLEEILGGEPCEITADEIFKITDLALAAQEAADSGEIVWL